MPPDFVYYAKIVENALFTFCDLTRGYDPVIIGRENRGEDRPRPYNYMEDQRKGIRMDNRELLRIAMEQSAKDLGAEPEDFCRKENVVVCRDFLAPDAKKYYEEPVFCNIVSYGNNIVASAHAEATEAVRAYVDAFTFYHCFETPNLYRLNEALLPFGQKVCFMAEYWLPDLKLLKARDCAYRTKILHPEDFASLYLPQWSNALCAGRRQLDVLGIGAYDGEKLVGFAACSADAEKMWQIGVDVLPDYRRRGIASALTSRLALEILSCGKVPFYCCAWSNIRSAGNAVRSGFIPTWAEMTAKPLEKISEMNG